MYALITALVALLCSAHLYFSKLYRNSNVHTTSSINSNTNTKHSSRRLRSRSRSSGRLITNQSKNVNVQNPNEKLPLARTVSFPGCAGGYHFMFGICHALRTDFDTSKMKFIAVSGSTYPVICILLPHDLKEVHTLWCNRFRRMQSQNPYSWLPKIYDLASVHSRAMIPVRCPVLWERIRNQISITVTHIPSLALETRSHFRDGMELNDYAVGSGFIPFLVGGAKAFYLVEKDGAKYRIVDGCLGLILRRLYDLVGSWRREGGSTGNDGGGGDSNDDDGGGGGGGGGDGGDGDGGDGDGGDGTNADTSAVLHVPFPNKYTPLHWIVTGIHGYNAKEQFDAGVKYARGELTDKIDPALRRGRSKPRNDAVPTMEEDGAEAFDLRGTILSEFEGKTSGGASP
jgi:hypothetical protein